MFLQLENGDNISLLQGDFVRIIEEKPLSPDTATTPTMRSLRDLGGVEGSTVGGG